MDKIKKSKENTPVKKQEESQKTPVKKQKL